MSSPLALAQSGGNGQFKEANSTQNPQIKQFIQQFEQMDQNHLQGAQNLPVSGSNNG